MITETEIKVKGFAALTKAMGEVQTEKFIALILREPFDYSKWQVDLFKDLTVEQLSELAMRERKKQKSRKK